MHARKRENERRLRRRQKRLQRKVCHHPHLRLLLSKL